ncbi:putative lipid II flippase FtsW [Sulfuriferula nivalis]|uniref:Probable peptidoglycan glycosyltransferase FtsW n=1 Tax=Sulfuriferula nivalis TaxID=2675298 RepID=A0A809S4L8_9PROT|nr:putative lipid II flippase FtsW [Sulfuriferula nivalis]BBP01958.1 putative lipid II flippase FtsW [Sulfuriferula nivalis]
MAESMTNRAASPRLRRHVEEFDYVLIWLTLALLSFGFVMVYSASIDIAEANKASGHNPWFFAQRHLMFLIIGGIAAYTVFQIPMMRWQKLAPWLFVGGLVLLALVLIPGLGRNVNGSQRWLPLGILNLQPSELMKLAAVLYAADYTVRKGALMHSVKQGFAPMLIAMLFTGALLLREPDFGAFVVIIAIAMSILFLGGLNLKIFGVLLVGLVVGFVGLIWSSPYRLQRIVGFMDPWADPYGKGYQLSHALIAFGRGQWTGLGLGGSVEKMFYLPEAHTDFLLAVIAEELGFVGVAFVIALFAALVLRAFQIGRTAAKLERHFCALTAMGIGVWLGVQACINIGVNVGLLPTKGLTLPFLSFGGSGIVANCMAIAILLRVDYETRSLQRGKKGT